MSTLIDKMVEAIRFHDGAQTYTDLRLATNLFDKACEGRHKIWNDAEIIEACKVAHNMLKREIDRENSTLKAAAHFAQVSPIDSFRYVPRIDQIRLLCLGLDLDTSEYTKRRARFEVLRYITNQPSMALGHRVYHLKQYLMGSNICIRYLDNTGWYGDEDGIWYDKGLWALLLRCEERDITRSRDLNSAIKKQLKIIGRELGFK